MPAKSRLFLTGDWLDRLKVLLLIDNGGWSMEPYVETVQALFHHARSQFKDLSIRYFHNTITDRVWRDPERRSNPETVEDLLRRDPETRLIFVGDASMAPEELLAIDGSIMPRIPAAAAEHRAA